MALGCAAFFSLVALAATGKAVVDLLSWRTSVDAARAALCGDAHDSDHTDAATTVLRDFELTLDALTHLAQTQRAGSARAKRAITQIALMARERAELLGIELPTGPPIRPASVR